MPGLFTNHTDLTIIIPYRQDVHNGLELRYALRSIQKYLTGWANVILIGDKPVWYKGEHIPASDFQGRKEYSIYNKLLIACDKVTDNLLMWNDDHFLLKPLDVKDIKYWHNGLLSDDLNRMIGGRYRLVVQKTLSLLDNVLGNVLFKNYDIHVPIIYNKFHFKDTFKDMTSEVCIKSYYSNRLPVDSEYMEDFKMDGDFQEKEILNKLHGKLFLSTGTCLCTAMVKVLGDLYPYKSNFEL